MPIQKLFFSVEINYMAYPIKPSTEKYKKKCIDHLESAMFGFPEQSAELFGEENLKLVRKEDVVSLRTYPYRPRPRFLTCEWEFKWPR